MYMRMSRLVVWLCLVGALVVVVVDPTPVTDSEGVNYLVQFGYMEPQDPRTGQLRTAESFAAAVKEFQVMAGLDPTGILDDITKTKMASPRCGVADRIGNGLRARRYAIQGSKWPKKHLTYKFVGSITSDLSGYDTRSEIAKAFQVWADVTSLTFEERASGRVDIEITFVHGEHGDGNPFDGQGRTLAHAYFPQFGGDAHFDEAETWTLKTRNGINLFIVAAHEFGHSLGLSHSDVQVSLMAPFYQGYTPDFKLDNDDIWAIQELYGRKTVPATPRPTRRVVPATTRAPVITGIPSICRDGKIDAITEIAGITYAFKGDYYYRLNDNGIDNGFPRAIQWDWNLDGPIDAAITVRGTDTFLFKGSQVWAFDNLQAKAGFPRPISDAFTGFPEHIDAAFEWSGNGKIYLVKGSQYWRVRESAIDAGYPRSLSVWSGIPNDIDAVFKYKNGRTYFFKGNNYYRYNDVEFTVDSGYPRNNSYWWFGCTAQQSQVMDKVPETDNNEDQYKNGVNLNPQAGGDNTYDNKDKNDDNKDDNDESSAESLLVSSVLCWLTALFLASNH